MRAEGDSTTCPSHVRNEQSTTVYLLGAGASVDAGIPASLGITRLSLSRSANVICGPVGAWPALNYVVATISVLQMLDGSDAYADVDVERLFSTIEMLASRREHEAAPFVEWDPAIERMDRSPSRDSSGARGIREEVLRLQPNDFSLASRLSQFIDAHLEQGTGHPVYDHPTGHDQGTVRRHRSARPQWTLISDPDTSVQPGSTLTLATLNYDLTIETLADRLGMPWDTGVDAWSKLNPQVPTRLLEPIEAPRFH